MSMIELADKLRTEGDAYVLLEQLRWGDRPVCPHCGSVGGHYFLTPANGRSRKTRTGAASERRVWKCCERGCRKQFSVLTGTIFHGTKIPVRKWLFVIFEMCASKNGVAAREIERRYHLTPRSAWFMLHRIREAMKQGPMPQLLSGRVVADETWIGGKPSNRHGHKRSEHLQGEHDRTSVMALVSRETGEVRSQIIPNVKSSTLRSVLNANVDATNTHLHTDQGKGYVGLAGDFAGHTRVSHEKGEYVRDGASTNQAENFFSQLKRSLDGTFHHVSVEHLPRYLAEFDYRHSTRWLTDEERTERTVRQTAGRRLVYSDSR
ncbi:MAG TPA: IS1595 family transposase [Solirubrobacteraceae bacterium]|nr:IS1595 family transposase [Solirubrobacteraceae bacterium]